MIILALLCAAQAHARDVSAYSAVGFASWYGHDFNGRRTSDGERFNMRSISAASLSLPLPCYARVTNLDNKKSMVVRVNDRGPYVHGRLIDVSERVAILLNFHDHGVAKVRVEYVGKAPATNSDESYLLSSLHVGESGQSEGVSAFASATNGPKDFAAVLSTLAAARRAAKIELRPAVLELSSAFGSLAASPYGDLVNSPFRGGV